MSQTVKFIYVRWLGEKIPTVKLGKYGVVHGSVVKHFQVQVNSCSLSPSLNRFASLCTASSHARGDGNDR